LLGVCILPKTLLILLFTSDSGLSQSQLQYQTNVVGKLSFAFEAQTNGLQRLYIIVFTIHTYTLALRFVQVHFCKWHIKEFWKLTSQLCLDRLQRLYIIIFYNTYLYSIHTYTVALRFLKAQLCLWSTSKLSKLTEYSACTLFFTIHIYKLYISTEVLSSFL